jgi:hypothetical protein
MPAGREYFYAIMRGVFLALAGVGVCGLIAAMSGLKPATPTEAGTCFLPLVMGDMTGGQLVFSSDALWLLRKNAGFPLPNGGHACSPEDVDCDGTVGAVDALKILRFVAGFEVTQTEPCINIGDEIPP